MTFPLFGFCDGDAFVFSTREDAETYIEPTDVENKEWRVFDSTGTKMTLNAVTQTSKMPFFSKADVEVTDTSSSNTEDDEAFKELLIASLQGLSEKYKRRYGIPDSDEVLKATPIKQLALLAQKAFRES